MQKRGLSTIVVTLIMIVLALVAVGTIWIVVSNLLKGQSDQVGLDKINFEAGITALSIDNSTNNVSVTVERKVGEANLEGMKFYFYNDTGTEVITEYFALQELGQKKFSFHLAMNISSLTKVSIVPLFESKDGKENIGNVEDTYDVKAGVSLGGGSSSSSSGGSPSCPITSYNYSCSESISIRLDNCGTYQNQTCTSTQVCVSNVTRCRSNLTTCIPTTCSALRYTCGTWANGTCSGTLNCGTCSSGSCVGGACQNISSLEFPIGVWLQSSLNEVNGINIAQLYKNIGVNTYIGLWKFPTEDWAYPGYTVLTLNILKNLSIRVYAGDNPNATAWINTHPEFNSTIVGYMLGDEPDMNRNSGVPEDAAANTPLAWKARGDALRAADSSRPIYANFGKPFAKDQWYGNENGQTGSKASDFGYYVSPLDLLSSDFYGITDPYEATNNHGIWTYGRAVTNTMKYAGSRPTWGFLEVAAPWYDGNGGQTQMYVIMPNSLVNPVAWNLIVHGAQGIIYFCHSFSVSTNVAYNFNAYSGGSSFAPLLIPGMPEAISATNTQIQSYANVLLTPAILGTTSNTTGVNVTTLTKNFGGATYIFAMGDGDSGHINGQAVDATITVSGAGTKTVRVLNENNRTIAMTNSRFTDHFDAYEVHIYHFQ
jgi:hypothetical protein